VVPRGGRPTPLGARACRRSGSARCRGARSLGHRQGKALSARAQALNRPFDADVLILGAGPAGSVVALNLAPTRRVILVDRRIRASPRIGEALPPTVRRLLADMGLLDRFLAEGHTPSYGNRMVWGADNAGGADFIGGPDGHGVASR